MRLNYIALKELARKEAKEKAKYLYPPHQIEKIKEAQTKLERKYYLQYITP